MLDSRSDLLSWFWPFVQVHAKSRLDETPHEAHGGQDIEYIQPLDPGGTIKTVKTVCRQVRVAAQSKVGCSRLPHGPMLSRGPQSAFPRGRQGTSKGV